MVKKRRISQVCAVLKGCQVTAFHKFNGFRDVHGGLLSLASGVKARNYSSANIIFDRRYLDHFFPIVIISLICYYGVVTWEIEFYRDKSGHEPVVKFLDDLPLKTRAKVVRMIDLLAEQGVLLKEPYTRQIKGKIRELRVRDVLGTPEYSISHLPAGALYFCTDS